MKVKIRPHINEDGVKNPEYLIDEKLADLKNIQGLGGIKQGLTVRKNSSANILYSI